MGKKIDLTGQQFGKLTVLYEEGRIKGNVAWKCQCECGNTCTTITHYLRNGDTKSCGCLQKEKMSRIKRNDLTGQVFGRLTVLKDSGERHYQNIVWECQCSCGNIVKVPGGYLISGTTKSCGCLQKEIVSNLHYEDLTGKKFNHLTVLKDSGERKFNKVVWECQCDCGNPAIVKTISYNLTHNLIMSCGCERRSKGEIKISQLLTENNISFETEKIFKNCKFPSTNGTLRFDFYLHDYNTIIEYDGIQHFISYENSWTNKEAVEKTKERDIFKNQWCKENNIKLIRIPYTDYNILDWNYLKEKIFDNF